MRRFARPGRTLTTAAEFQQCSGHRRTRDRLGTHLRDELGLDSAKLARPLQASLVSAASFASLGMLPIVGLLLAPAQLRIAVVAIVCVLSLGVLGALGGQLGDAPRWRAALRVMLGGSAAMAATALIGRLLHVAGVG